MLDNLSNIKSEKSRIGRNFLLILLCIFTISGCASHKGANNYQKELAKYFLELSKIEKRNHNKAAYHRAYEKYSKLIKGQYLAPDDVGDYNIDRNLVPELVQARKELIEAIKDHKIQNSKFLSLAKAHYNFDCFIEEYKKYPPSKPFLVCKKNFEDSMRIIRGEKVIKYKNKKKQQIVHKSYEHSKKIHQKENKKAKSKKHYSKKQEIKYCPCPPEKHEDKKKYKNKKYHHVENKKSTNKNHTKHTTDKNKNSTQKLTKSKSDSHKEKSKNTVSKKKEVKDKKYQVKNLAKTQTSKNDTSNNDKTEKSDSQTSDTATDSKTDDTEKKTEKSDNNDIKAKQSAIEPTKQIKNYQFNFAAGGTEIIPKDNKSLLEIAGFLMHKPNYKIIINAYSESKDNDDAAIKMSKARANNIRQALILMGIKDSNIQSFAFSSPESGDKNRADIKIIIEENLSFK